jgi:hypothetical protein
VNHLCNQTFSIEKHSAKVERLKGGSAEAFTRKDLYNLYKRNTVKLRGNIKWCFKFKEDLTLPRFIGDVPLGKDENGNLIFPSHFKSVKPVIREAISLPSANYKDRKYVKSERGGKAWWRGLTLTQQADYRYKKMIEKKGYADWQYEYNQCLKEGNFRKCES